jgi:hypothetical protein
MNKEMLIKQRKGQRRRHRAIYLFPLNDMNGNQVKIERRQSPDRRLDDVAFDVVNPVGQHV